MRAMVSQPTAPMAMNSAARLPRGNTVDRMMTMKTYGSAYTMSTKRIIAASIAPAEIARDRAPGDADARRSPASASSAEQPAKRAAPACRARTGRARAGRCRANAGFELRRRREVLPVERVVAPGRDATAPASASSASSTEHDATRVTRAFTTGARADRASHRARSATRLQTSVNDAVDEDHAHDQRVVAIDGALHEIAARTRQAEHGLDHQRAGDDERHGRSEITHHRDQRGAQRVAQQDHARTAGPWRARCG